MILNHKDLYLMNQLFTEKYRPKTLDDLIVPERVMNQFKNGVQTNFLLHGNPGTGKTSAAKALCNHFGNDMLYINASLEGRIDVIKNKIESFAHSFSLIPNDRNNGEKRYKVVILDEIDGSSAQFFDAFKGFIEATEKTTRFILTSNHINKIPPAIQSRFGGGMSFDFEKDEEKELIKKYLVRIKDILENEGVYLKGAKYNGKQSEEGWDTAAIIELIKRKYPDFRSILMTLNAFVIEGKEEITIDDIKKGYSVHKDIFELILGPKDPRKNYQYIVSNYSRDVDAVFSSLQTEFVEYLSNSHPQKSQYIPQLIVTLAKYQYECKFVNDPVVSLLACIFEYQNILAGGK